MDDFKIIQVLHENHNIKTKILLCERDNEQYIMKVLNNENLKDLELYIHTTLKHVKLIKYITHFNDGVYTRIILEKANADLLDLVTSHAVVSLPEVSYIVRQILEFLRYLHTQNIAHVDIKPENVVLFEKNKIKVIDFGLARKIGDLQLYAIGTPDYMPPEIKLLHEKLEPTTITNKIDVWCLGCLAYELVFKTAPPSVLPGFVKMETQLINQNFNKILHVHYFVDFLKQTLKFAPEDRQSVKELLNHPFITNVSFVQ